MSHQAAADGGSGMKDSGDGGNNGGDKKGKRIAEKPDSLPAPASDGESTDDQDDDDQTEVDGGKATRSSTFDCLASLEASLPMKRGLSSHYQGKSKSFGNLNEMGIEDAKELGKKEHAVNKRRRLTLAHEYYDNSTMTHTSSMPSFNSHRKDEDEEDNKDGSRDDRNQQEEDGK